MNRTGRSSRSISFITECRERMVVHPGGLKSPLLPPGKRLPLIDTIRDGFRRFETICYDLRSRRTDRHLDDPRQHKRRVPSFGTRRFLVDRGRCDGQEGTADERGSTRISTDQEQKLICVNPRTKSACRQASGRFDSGTPLLPRQHHSPTAGDHRLTGDPA